jgi:hypothetical protein
MSDETAWADALEALLPHVVRIRTPLGRGTGFLVSKSKQGSLCVVATAAHVVEHAHAWEEVIRIDHLATGQSVALHSNERALVIDHDHDTAAILFATDALPLPATPLALGPERRHLKVGMELGWVGYPAMSESNLCFFGGRVSAWVGDQNMYLVDGVAINGVSGGPAFTHYEVESGAAPMLAGVVSAYMPNVATGTVLPGLSVVRDVSQFHELAKTLKSLDAAKEVESSPEAKDPRADEAVS